MAVKYGVKVQMFSIRKYLNCKIEPFVLFPFLTSELIVYANLKILKLKDQIVLQNCLFVHDTLSKVSPICFQVYFKQTRVIHSLNTKSANLGCLFVTHSGSVRYGLNSTTNKCIYIKLE